MRTIHFDKTSAGRCAVADFLDAWNSQPAQKVAWVLQLSEEFQFIPGHSLNKLVNTADIGAVRVQFGGSILRLLGFFEVAPLLILTNGFAKQTQRTPADEIEWAEPRKRDYLVRQASAMSDGQRYITKRKTMDKPFVDGFEAGYAEVRIGVLLRQARQAAGLTQAAVAQRLGTQKSAISRIENHAENVTLATLKAYAQAVGGTVQLQFVFN